MSYFYVMKKYLAITIFLFAVTSCNWFHRKPTESPETVKDTVYPLGFCTDSFEVVTGSIKSGDTFSAWVSRLGVPRERMLALTQACDTVFDVRKLRAGNTWSAYYADSTDLRYIVYDNSRTRQTVFQIKDSLAVWRYDKLVETVQKSADVTITSSLWNDMIAARASP